MYIVHTSEKETRAVPCAFYYIFNCVTESEAIQEAYRLAENGQKPTGYLGEYQIPDYTCAFDSKNH